MSELPQNLLNPTTFIIISAFLIFAIVIITSQGKSIKAKFGNKIIQIGGEGKKTTTSITTIKKKRSCGDCVLLLMGEREKHETQVRKEENKVLKAQMTFTEQKIIGIQNKILNGVSEALNNDAEKEQGKIEEAIQYKLIYGLVKDALLTIKDEIRRSFKDNGFYGINGSEFAWYTKERHRIITDILNLHIQNIYPDKESILRLHSLFCIIKNESTYLSGTINEIYSFAREVKLDSENKTEDLMSKFSQWVDNFTKE